MKFANYKFYARGVNNLGDNMQIIAIDEIYRQMGIKQDEIVYINMHELDVYSGEYVVLPVTMPLVDYKEKGIASRFSDRIIPVFLGLTLVKETLILEEIAYYNRYAPIGCRDERTLSTMRKYHIESYLHGCITVTLPLRNTKRKKFDKIYIVDAPKNVKKYMPKDLIDKIVYKTHMHPEKIEDPKALMKEYYNEYKENAGLVITSLLHCSVPCFAAGIPVLLVKNKVSYRFGWLEKLFKIYSEDELQNIDWQPKPVLYEEHKRNILDLTIKRLSEVYATNTPILDISYFYENREKKIYIIDACESLKSFIDTTWIDKQKQYIYAVWGLTQIAEYMVEYISDNFPNAKLSHVYDSFRQENFYGLTSENPENIRNFPNETILVSTNGAEMAARKLFEDIKKIEKTYAFVELIQ